MDISEALLVSVGIISSSLFYGYTAFVGKLSRFLWHVGSGTVWRNATKDATSGTQKSETSNNGGSGNVGAREHQRYARELTYDWLVVEHISYWLLVRQRAKATASLKRKILFKHIRDGAGSFFYCKMVFANEVCFWDEMTTGLTFWEKFATFALYYGLVQTAR